MLIRVQVLEAQEPLEAVLIQADIIYQVFLAVVVLTLYMRVLVGVTEVLEASELGEVE
jgi:hypothetical protein